jgi:hypothetical protein
VAILALWGAPGGEAGFRGATARLAQAQYVALGFDVGETFVSELDALAMHDRVTPEDRRALEAVRDLLEDWDQYVIVTRPQEAQLIVAVRKGRRVSGSAAVPLRPPVAGQTGSGPTFRGELSTARDVLSVYESDGGRPGMLVWQEMHADGFSGASPRLVEAFRKDVERLPRKP